MSKLTFQELRDANTSRVTQWHPEDSEPWMGSDWSNACLGELGEAANVVKKLRRIETGVPGSRDPDRTTLLDMLADELADTMCYLDLLASYYNIDLGAATIRKFNAVSDREGFPHKLGSS